MKSESEKLIELAESGMKENRQLDFKVSFDYNNQGEKLKLIRHMVAMANTAGGVIVFGVDDNGHSVRFDNSKVSSVDTADIADQVYRYTNSDYDSFEIMEVNRGHSKKMAILTLRSEELIVFSKDGQYEKGEGKSKGLEFQKGDLYFRHGSKSERCNANDLRQFANRQREKERKAWNGLFSRVSKVGPSNTGVLDVVRGRLEGESNSLLIDESLAEKLQFIKEGSFSKKGRPTLKLIGDVQPVSVKAVGTTKKFQITDDPNAPSIREEDVLKLFPLTHADLVNRLKDRYLDFKVTPEYHSIKKRLIKNSKLARVRLLDPAKPRSGSKVFYSEKIVKEFDAHYEKK